MSFLKEVNRDNLILLLKIKIPFILLLSFLTCNAQEKSNDFYGYYFSNQSTDFDKIILYHFSKDSLLIFNSNSRNLVKLSAEYESNSIYLSNDIFKNYKLNFKTNNKSIINLTDFNEQLSLNKENKLVKFSVDDKIKVEDFAYKYWEQNFDNDNQLTRYFDSKTKRIDNYHIYNDSNTKICDPSIRAYFRFKDVFVIDYIMSGELYVIAEIDYDTLTLKTIFIVLPIV